MTERDFSCIKSYKYIYEVVNLQVLKKEAIFVLNSNPLWWGFVGEMIEFLSLSQSFSVSVVEPRKINKNLEEALKGPLHSWIKGCSTLLCMLALHRAICGF